MPVRTVDAATLRRWLDNREAILVDVREPAEHHSESIQEAILLPLRSVGKSSLPPCTGKKLVIHCRKGGRGGSACEKLLAEDPALDIYNLEGGIDAWKTAGLMVASRGRCCLPLDRQVQLAVGFCVLAGSVLAYATSPLFLLLTGFFGAGLLFAGLTGFCGLSRLLAILPWNQKTGG